MEAVVAFFSQLFLDRIGKVRSGQVFSLWKETMKCIQSSYIGLSE